MITPDGYQPVGALPISGIAKIHREADLAEEDLIKANAAKRLAEMQKPTLEVVGEAIGQLSHRIFGGGDKGDAHQAGCQSGGHRRGGGGERWRLPRPHAVAGRASCKAESPAVADEPVVIEEPTKEAQPPAEAPAVADEAKEAAGTLPLRHPSAARLLERSRRRLAKRRRAFFAACLMRHRRQ